MRHFVAALCLFASLQVFAETKITQTKIYVPVVATDAGKPALGLQTADFTVQGAYGIQLDSAQLVQPEALNDPAHTTPVFILYDAYMLPATLQTMYGDSLLAFLGQVAEKHNAVTLVVNTLQGLRPVYHFATDPKILAAALTALNQKTTPTDPEVAKQLERLKILKTFVPTPASLDMMTALQMDGLTHMAQILKQSPNRKALIWMTWNYLFGTGDYTTHWLGSSSGQSHQLDSLASANGASWLAENQTDTRFNNLPPLYQRSIDALNEAHTSVYPLQLYDKRGVNANLTTGSKVENFTADGLKQVASCTGGFSFKSFATTDVSEAVNEVRADFGPYYMLNASSTNIKRTDWVPLKVAVNKPGVTVRTPPGFLGLSASALKSITKQ